MLVEHMVAIAGLAFLMTFGVMLIFSVRAGREVCERFAQRYPQEYAEHKSPRPSVWYSQRRAAYFDFVLKRHFEQLPDRALVESFEVLRRREIRELVFMLTGFGVLGLAWVYIELLGGGG